MCECCGGDCRLTSGELQEIVPPPMSNLGRKVLQEDLDWVHKRSGISEDLMGCQEKRKDIREYDCMLWRIQDIGRAEQRLKMVLDDDLFEGLDRKNPYWQTGHEELDYKLEETRVQISCLHDNLWDIMQILRYGREKDE